MNTLPKFFKDNSKSDHFELVIDFFISWTLRCSEKKYLQVSPKVNRYSKIILSKLIFDDENFLNDKDVDSVIVYKQHIDRIDLWIEVEINAINQKFTIIIETKMYSGLKEEQLKKYWSIANKYYEGNNDNIDLVFVVLRPDYEINKNNSEEELCKRNGYKYFNLEELNEYLPSETTGNELFDEFWFNW